MKKIIVLNNVSKDYRQGEKMQTVLHGISLEIVAGEFVAIVELLHKLNAEQLSVQWPDKLVNHHSGC